MDKGGTGLSFLPAVFRAVQLKGGGGKGCTRATDVLRRRVTGLTVFPGKGEESVLFAGGGGGGVTGDIWVRRKDVTGLAVLPGVIGEVLRAGYGWQGEGCTEATWVGK